MTTYAPTRLATPQRSNSDARRRPAPDWSPLSHTPESTLRRSRSGRDSGRSRPPFPSNDIWNNFEDHERRDADYKQANALQPRHAFHNRAQSADNRINVPASDRSGRGLTPERHARFDKRPSSDPQTPRFEELPDDLADSLADRVTVVDDEYDTDDYEAPSTLFGQAQDCMKALARAGNEIGGQLGSDESPAAIRCKDTLFRLKVWIAEANLEKMPAKATNDLDDEVITLVSSILYRLHARIRALARSNKRSKASASFSFAAPVEKDVEVDASESEDGSKLPSMELPSTAQIDHHLKQVDLQIRTLRRLTRSLRVVQKDETSLIVMKHVAEVTHLFGDSEGCDKWKDEVRGMPADAALRRVKEIAGVCG